MYYVIVLKRIACYAMYVPQKHPCEQQMLALVGLSRVGPFLFSNVSQPIKRIQGSNQYVDRSRRSRMCNLHTLVFELHKYPQNVRLVASPPLYDLLYWWCYLIIERLVHVAQSMFLSQSNVPRGQNITVTSTAVQEKCITNINCFSSVNSCLSTFRIFY